jgi:predicted O-methyltransferase YrrM
MFLICCGMYRACSTWQYLVVSELVETQGLGQRLGFLDAVTFSHVRHSFLDNDQLLVLKCHDFHPVFGELIESGRAKAIYSYRDVRDVTCSLMRKMMLSFEQVVAGDSPLRKAIASYYQWTGTSDTLVQSYEAIVSNPVESVCQITAYVGLSINEQQARAIAQKFSLEANRQRAWLLTKELRKQGKDLVQSDSALLYNSHTLLHWNHFSSGPKTNWRETLGANQLLRLEPIIGRWLIDAGFEKNNSWVFNSALDNSAGEGQQVRIHMLETNPSVTFASGESQWLNPVQLGTTTLLNLSTQRSTVEAVITILQQLESDEYIEFMKDYYAEGLKRFGDFWGYSDQLTILYAAAKVLRPQNYLEIGVFRGRSMAVVANVAPECNLYGFDLWIKNYSGLQNPGPEHVQSQVRRVGHQGELVLTSGDSKETVPAFLEDLPDLLFDLVTVDGDHSQEGARIDLENVLPRVKVGGVLVFDDICHPQHPWLDRAWDEVVGSNPNFISEKYAEVGHGVAFAIRRYTDEEIDAVRGSGVERRTKLSALLEETKVELSMLNAQLTKRDEELASVKAVLRARDEELASVKAVWQAREEELASTKSLLQAYHTELDFYRSSLLGRVAITLRRLKKTA